MFPGDLRNSSYDGKVDAKFKAKAIVRGANVMLYRVRVARGVGVVGCG